MRTTDFEKNRQAKGSMMVNKVRSIKIITINETKQSFSLS
jgi:hypothetical protein